MELFDLHCDTIVHLRSCQGDFCCERTQFSLKNLHEFERLCQIMAVFIPDTLRGEQAFQYFKIHKEYLENLALQQRGLLQLVYNFQSIPSILEDRKCAIILSVESGAVLAGRLENIEYLKRCGVKLMTLTWNDENEIASGHLTAKGFTSFGRNVVKEMEKQEIIVDVSHLNDIGFEELCGFATKPFIATHSNLRSICKHKRNLTEEQFKEIIRRKGLVGLNLYQRFLSNTGDGTVEDLFRHAYRMLELGGEDVISCGSDFDGAQIHSSLNTPKKFAKTCDYFSEMGIDDTVIRKIFFDNALHFFVG
jgi:membrane dipeptidase